MSSLRLLALASLLLSLTTAGPASAQSTRRPDLNPFGRGFRDSSQSLSAIGNLGATFYDVIQRRTTPVDGRQVPDKGWGTFASGALRYTLSFPSISFNASVGATAVYYPSIGTTVRTRVLPVGGTGLSYSWALSDRTSLRVSTQAGYRPAYAEQMWGGGFGGRIGIPEVDPGFLHPDATLVGSGYLAVDSGAALRHDFSRRWSGSLSYGYGHDFVFEDEESSRFRRRYGWTQHGGGALHFRVSRSLSVRGGYRFRETHYRGREPFRTHTADVGVDFGEGATIELARDTRLTFGVGASSFVNDDGRQRYRVTGDAVLTHDLGRTWRSTLGYARGVSSSEILFDQPVLRDTVTASLNGLLSRRIGFHALGRVSHGQVGLGGGDNGHTTIAAVSGIQYAVHQQIALSVDYVYYQRQFGGDVTPVAGLSNRSAGQTVRAYLRLWAPIFQRRPNAAR
jgi:hypothetical protein